MQHYETLRNISRFTTFKFNESHIAWITLPVLVRISTHLNSDSLSVSTTPRTTLFFIHRRTSRRILVTFSGPPTDRRVGHAYCAGSQPQTKYYLKKNWPSYSQAKSYITDKWGQHPRALTHSICAKWRQFINILIVFVSEWVFVMVYTLVAQRFFSYLHFEFSPLCKSNTLIWECANYFRAFNFFASCLWVNACLFPARALSIDCFKFKFILYYYHHRPMCVERMMVCICVKRIWIIAFVL